MDDIALLSACGTPTCVNVSATHSGFPQDGAVLEMIWVHVRKLAGEGRGKSGEREKGRNSECVFWGREEERTGEELEREGVKALTDCHGMYS